MKRNIFILLLVIFTVTLMLWVGRRAAQNRAESGQPLSGRTLKGAPAPDFELKSLDGRTVRLSDYRGKAVLLNFWATWCPPCKIEMPWFVDLQKQYGGQGLQVIGIAMDDDAEKDSAKIAEFVKEMNLNYVVLLGNDKVGDAYGGVDGLPTTFYIGRDGRILTAVSGLVSHSEIEENIKKALAAQSTVANAGGQR
ncbi:MAG TPA: TlpA disulfide reductase family protein [Terriglobales bacterium]|nr:TlpA disulfide reductase family protein [Terriglobales bacterium]